MLDVVWHCPLPAGLVLWRFLLPVKALSLSLSVSRGTASLSALWSNYFLNKGTSVTKARGAARRLSLLPLMRPRPLLDEGR